MSELKRKHPMTCADCHAPMTAVQYRGTPEDYDGISEWWCVTCGFRIGRWSGKILGPDELEPRYGIKREDTHE